MNSHIMRRDLLRAGAAAGLSFGMADLFPAWAQTGSAGLGSQPDNTLSGDRLHLVVDHSPFRVNGRAGHAVTVNGTLPAPLLRLREGQRVKIEVENRLEEETSIHWHGLIVPFDMDGVPGVSFPGIEPRSTFTYEFPVR
jgi:FtsP/CotA-like multicopper oxidase with cupredoxin domain